MPGPIQDQIYQCVGKGLYFCALFIEDIFIFFKIFYEKKTFVNVFIGF